MISRKIAEQTLSEALKTGADFAELFLQDKRSNTLALLDGHIEDAVTGRRHGAGIRVIKGLNSVYVHTNDTTLTGLVAAARSAAPSRTVVIAWKFAMNMKFSPLSWRSNIDFIAPK